MICSVQIYAYNERIGKNYHFPTILTAVCYTSFSQTSNTIRNYWQARLSCQFHHSLAALSIRRSLVFRQKLLRFHTDDAVIDNILQPQMELPVYSVGSVFAGHRT